MAAYAGWSDWFNFGKQEAVANEVPTEVKSDIFMQQQQRMIQQLPIQQQIQIEEKSSCDRDLEYLEKEMKAHPNDEKYFRFKLEKLQKRCENL